MSPNLLLSRASAAPRNVLATGVDRAWDGPALLARRPLGFHRCIAASLRPRNVGRLCRIKDGHSPWSPAVIVLAAKGGEKLGSPQKWGRESWWPQ